MQSVPSSQLTVRQSRVIAAALAAAGASLIAMYPANPTTVLPRVEHHAVKLTAGGDEVDWQTFLTNTEGNLTTLQGEATTASETLTKASDALSAHFEGQISNAVTGFDSGVQNAIDGGFYGGDDGYVDGLFPGVINSGPDAPHASIGTLAEISQALSAGNTEQAFSYFDLFSLETLDHTLQPLLGPLLDETSGGYNGTAVTTTFSIPEELSQLQTNLIQQFGTYGELKSLGDAVLAPQLSVGFEFTKDLDTIATELGSGDYTDATANFNNLTPDVLNALFNGFSTGSTTGESTFTGLLNSGSLLQDLLATWPTQFATALSDVTYTATAATTTTAAESASALATDLLGGL